ncbi:putative flagellar biosynthesis regulator FlhF [Herminiimonas arsenicoxydans]|uniref:Flagellar biosynthesis protein FlhF n=1 Tax=Herminiimonas arsenicoxydans TaxID=204773 RepID=A4G4P8_HERAR|nr:putative flagellar biosynthesis regulator FlhF [Herminiimonas arsenicoxydans]
MNVRKFTASTSRGAWSLVREALGPDAVILSNRAVEGGVEILALAGEDMASLAEPMVEKTISETTLAALAPRYQAQQAAQPAPPAIASRASLQTAASEINSAELHSVMSEIRSMRGMLEMQLAELAWTDQHKREPAKSSVLREMLAAGFSASLARYLTERMPAGASKQSGMDWIKAILTRNLATIGNENEILEKGGVYALVGPTGVGKTTTTAKLAARCVMRHGPGKLALITTDGYRIGGYEQLRIYGKILGVMVHSVKDEADLRIALDELKGKHTVLIDTVGVSQRDNMVAEQIAMLSGAGSQVKRLLCLNATSTGETLNEVARSYMGDGLAGCILTKLDEAATIGSALDVVIRQKLNLYYVANGQRVPEDLHVANQQYLVDRAFKLKRETAPFQFSDAEIPLVMANTAKAMNDKSLREVILG